MMTTGQTLAIAFRRLRKNWVKFALAALLLTLPAVLDILLNDLGETVISNVYGYNFDDISTYITAFVANDEAMLELYDVALMKSALVPYFIVAVLDFVLMVVNYAAFTLPLCVYFLGVAQKTDPTVKGALRFVWKSIPVTLWMGLKLVLWFMLFIIPGIYKAIMYSQTLFIKAENPDMKANDCIKRSIEMMRGRRMKFVLLCVVVFGIIFIAEFIIIEALALISLFAGVILSVIINLVFGIIEAAIDAVITVVATEFAQTCYAVFYVDLKRSYLSDIEQDLRKEHESGDTRVNHGDPFAENTSDVTDAEPNVEVEVKPTNVSHDDPFGND